MPEYIDIDAQVVVTDTRGKELETTVRHILDMNKGVYTAADVRPVVLCRDCRSYNRPRLGFCEMHLVRMHGDDFCSYGEKREES